MQITMPQSNCISNQSTLSLLFLLYNSIKSRNLQREQRRPWSTGFLLFRYEVQWHVQRESTRPKLFWLPFWKGVYSKRKEFAPKNSFTVDPFSERDWCTGMQTEVAKVVSLGIHTVRSGSSLPGYRSIDCQTQVLIERPSYTGWSEPLSFTYCRNTISCVACQMLKPNFAWHSWQAFP